MDIQLIQGDFSSADALSIIEKMIEVKINYHEKAIQKNSSEEDIKYRESKIKYLQSELSELKKQFILKKDKVTVNAVLSIE